MKTRFKKHNAYFNTLFQIGFFVAIVFIGTGCTSTATKTDFLSGNATMHRGAYLENFWSADGLTKQTCSRIYFEPVDVSRIKDKSGITASAASDYLRTTVVFNIESHTSWKIVEQPDAATAKLTLAITHLTPGSAFGRTMAGEVGVGLAGVQVEGKLTDASTGKEIVCFTDRRSNSGAIGFEDMAGDAGPKLVTRLLKWISEDFVKELSTVAK